jgi:hypothetical protein
MSKDNVSQVMLAKAMERVGNVVGPKGEVHQLNCESKGDGNVTCNAIGNAVYRVSFSNEAKLPVFELAGERAASCMSTPPTACRLRFQHARLIGTRRPSMDVPPCGPSKPGNPRKTE